LEKKLMDSRITKLSIAGAACYAIWGCLHINAGYNVFMLGDSVDPGMVRGRLHQGGWNLFFFGVTAIGVAVTLNIRNSKWGYWINFGVLALADTGLIFFVLIPGYWAWWPGLAGPILWIAGLILTTLAYLRDVPGGGKSRP
jgi:hypothetical protein